jgi:hypothetical protein
MSSPVGPVDPIQAQPINSTAAAPALSFGGSVINSSGTGFFCDTYGEIGVSCFASEVFRFSSSGVTLTNSVAIMTGAGVPTDAVTGANYAGPGSMYVDITNKDLYINANTKASPTWKLVTRAA